MRLTEFISEDELNNGVSRVIFVLGGRYQPAHPGHHAVYNELTKRFGSDDVFITTSNKVDNKKSFLNFEEKKAIWTTLFGVDATKVAFATNPAFKPTELLKGFPDDTAFVVVTSEKDKSRYGKSSFYKPLPEDYSAKLNEMTPYESGGYYLVVPEMADGISGTEIREIFQNPTNCTKAKKDFFKKSYGRYDETLFQLINRKLNGDQ